MTSPPIPPRSDRQRVPRREARHHGIQPTTAPLSPLEADTLEADTDCLEVIVKWGDEQVLQVDYVDLAGSFVIGDESEGPVDFLTGAALVGTARLALIEGGQITVPAAAEVLVLRAGEVAQQAPTLAAGETCILQRGELRFIVRRVRQGKEVKRQAVAFERQPFFFVGGTLAVAGFLLGLFALMPPHGAALAIDGVDQNSRLVQYLMEPRVSETVAMPEEVAAEEPGGTAGQAHAGDEGEMGDRNAPNADAAYAVAGPADNEDPHLARERLRDQAATAGILGTLQAMVGSMDSPTSPFGRDTALGTDSESFLGHLMGANPGEAHGFGGLGLRGTGHGGGGPGLGTVGVGNHGTLGHGCRGSRCSEGTRYGSGVGGEMSREGRTPPRITSGRVDAIGALSKEAIRRVVHRHRNEVKFCYEQGLQGRPDLEGRVTMRFMIAPSGAVQVATVQSSSLANQGVEQCVTQAVRRWAFPQPEGGGMVMVTYPFSMTPAGG